MLVRDEPSRGDIARGLIGVVCATIVMALLYEPTVKLAIPKALLFTGITVVCVVTARSKAAVLLGIGAIVVLRLIIGIVLFGHRFN
jgi:hypothetical protein